MNDASNTANVRDVLSKLSPADWARFGADQIAYMRPEMQDGHEGIAIYAADGTKIGEAPDMGLAVAAIREHSMMPALVH
ncbi:hypothetical protein IAI18_10905 [Acetobacteraceae bacterium H6797]|nr:hypothetical protein [Acetobacteraceae bacterium H6797]